MLLPNGNAKMLRAAISGFEMEHGFKPDFILMTSDVAKAIFIEVDGSPAEWKGFVKNVPGQHMAIMDIEVAQLQGVNRLELVSDPTHFKFKKKGLI